MKNLTIKDAQKEVLDFLNERGWFPKNSLGRYYTFVHAIEELGEVARCITYLESKRGKAMEKDKKKVLEELELEIGDTMYHVLKLGIAYGINVNDAFVKSMDKIKKKFEKFKL